MYCLGKGRRSVLVAATDTEYCLDVIWRCDAEIIGSGESSTYASGVATMGSSACDGTRGWTASPAVDHVSTSAFCRLALHFTYREGAPGDPRWRNTYVGLADSLKRRETARTAGAHIPTGRNRPRFACWFGLPSSGVATTGARTCGQNTSRATRFLVS